MTIFTSGLLSGVVTIALMLIFLGIWFWAWRPRHRPTFDRLARMPLEDLDSDATEAWR